MKSSGMKTRDERKTNRNDRETNLTRAFQRGLKQCGFALLNEAHDVFDYDNRIIDNESGRNRQRHEREVVEAVSASHITPNVPASASGIVIPEMNVGQKRRRKRNITITTSAIVMRSVS